MAETPVADSMVIRENLLDLSFQKSYLQRVYFWMFAGLLVSGSTAYLVYKSPLLSKLILDSFLIFFGLLITEIVIVVKLSNDIDILTPLQARAMYLLYTFTTGLTLLVMFFCLHRNLYLLSLWDLSLYLRDHELLWLHCKC